MAKGARPRRHRLDQELVDQGFFENVDDAMRAVMAGDVSTSNRKLTSAGEQVRPGLSLHVRGHLAYVSRGALKLQRGLDAFDVSPEGMACVDVGCSTGGFTDCLLRRGAASVLSVDVGYAQFDWSLRQDGRVTLLERTNIVDVPTMGYAGSMDLAVCDVSFTSVVTVLNAVCELLNARGMFLTLVKPQFEAAREDVGEGGVVRDPQVRLRTLERVADALRQAGMGVRGACTSPITGHKGNVEYLLLGCRKASFGPLDLKAVVYDGASLVADAQ